MDLKVFEMDEQLIEKVREHEVLYNHGLLDYRDQNVRQTAWREIGNELQISANEAKQRWESLRRCFYNARNRRRDRAKSGLAHLQKPSWKFEEQMSYILPFLTTRNKMQWNLNESNLVAESEDLTEETETEDIVPSQVDREIERDVQDNQAIEIDSASNEVAAIQKCYKAVKRVKIQEQNTTQAGQLVEISALRKHQYEEKNTHQTVWKPTSGLENLDDTDLFFLSMSKMTKQLPKLEQSQIKLALSNFVLSAEIRCNEQSFSTTPNPCSQSCLPQQSFNYTSTTSPLLKPEPDLDEYLSD